MAHIRQSGPDFGPRARARGFELFPLCSAAVYQMDVEQEFVRLIDSCITQLKAQGPSRTCNESKEVYQVDVEEEFLLPLGREVRLYTPRDPLLAAKRYLRCGLAFAVWGRFWWAWRYGGV